MSDLRVPKHKVAVEVLFLGGTREPLELFLAETARSHAGPEELSDLLAGSDLFLPAIAPGPEKTCFLNRQSVVAIVVDDPGAGADPALAHTLPTAHEVELRLSDGQTLRGVVAYLRPPERSRIGDFLNEPEPVLRLRQAGRLLFVNKSVVTRVDILGS